MNISELKNGAKPKEENPSTKEGMNIDGEKVRDFGNGLKEFDPTANGFEAEKKELKPDDVTAALQEFDSQMEKRREEVETYNELLDQYGGQITEEELREELGQENITKVLKDGAGQENEDAAGKKVDVSGILKDNDKREETYHDSSTVQETTLSTEDDELEKELEEDDYTEEQYVATVKPVINTAPPIKEEPKETKVMPEVTTNNTETTESKEEARYVPATLSDEDKDLAALDDDYTAPTDDFDEKLRAELSKKVNIISKKFDLSSAVVINKPVTVTNTLSKVTPIDRKIFTWGLLRSKRPITMKAFTATELNNLNSIASNSARGRETFTAIWNHIVGPGKGKDFDTWAKCTPYIDTEHIWFAVYGACFSTANYLPFTCASCNEVTVSTNIPIDSMCKYESPEVKEEMNAIRNMTGEPDMGNVFAEARVQISDNLAVGFKEPSIYDALIVPYMFDNSFREKYSDIIAVCMYLSNIYNIEETAEGIVLRPIAVKQFAGNEVKTMKAKIIQYAKILRSLPSDQYNIILAHVTSINNEVTKLTYELPSVTCDHCHKEIKGETASAMDLVFMRHQLAAMMG